MKSQKLLAACILCCVLSSCHKDIYDPEALGRDYFIPDVPENFDWSTTASVNLKVTPVDQYNSQYVYTIEVFGKNPLTTSQPPLYSYGWANTNQLFQKDITIPDADTLLYVRQTSPGGRKCIMTIPVSANRLICDFNLPESAVKSKTTALKAGNNEIVTEAPADAIALEGPLDMTLQTGHNYVINNTYSGKLTFPGEGDCSLYIKGTWMNPGGDTRLEKNSNIYILENGQLLSDGSSSFTFPQSKAIISIAHNGQLGSPESDQISIVFENQGELLNAGSVHCNSIKAYSNNMYILNQGKFYAHELITMDVAFTFRNECYANIKNVYLNNGSQLSIAPLCSFVCENLKITNASVHLDYSSLLKANTITASNWGNNSIKGNGSKPALVEIDELISTMDWKPGIVISGKLHLRCKKFPANEKSYQVTCVIEDPSSDSSIEIQPSECSQGNDYIPEQPEQPEFPKEITYNQTYTYTSEDNFPSPGDYDMNDLVVSMDSISYYYPETNKISRMTWHLTLRAVGATHQLGAAIQIDDLPSSAIKNVTYSREMPLDVFNLNDNRTEKEQDYAVIPLFDNGHKTLGCNNTVTIINTVMEPSPRYDISPFSFDVTLEFTTPLEEGSIGLEKLNYFTIVGNKPKQRVEIHLPQYKHTNLSNSPKELQTSTEKYMWTIKIPGIFKYPQEWTEITKAYPEFKSWVQSGSQNNKDWYTNPLKEYLYK